MHLHPTLLGVALLLPLARLSAATIDYSTVISPGSELDGKSIYVEDGLGGPSHVTIERGVTLEGLSVGGSSSVVMFGGMVDASVNVNTRASFTMLDGAVEGISARGPIQLQINGGAVARVLAIGTTRNTPGLPSAIINGGVFGEDVLIGAGKLLIAGGDFQRIHPEGTGVVQIAGGRMTAISAWNDSVVHYSGGEITGDFDLNAYGATIHVYGSHLVYNRSESRLDGILSDGTVIDDYDVYLPGGRLILHNAPEPATWTLACVGLIGVAGIMRRRGRCSLSRCS